VAESLCTVGMPAVICMLLTRMLQILVPFFPRPLSLTSFLPISTDAASSAARWFHQWVMPSLLQLVLRSTLSVQWY